MVYYITIHVGQDTSSIYIDSGFNGSKLKGKKLLDLLNNGER